MAFSQTVSEEESLLAVNLKQDKRPTNRTNVIKNTATALSVCRLAVATIIENPSPLVAAIASPKAIAIKAKGNAASVVIRRRYVSGCSRVAHRDWKHGKKVRHPTATTLCQKYRSPGIPSTKTHQRIIVEMYVCGSSENRRFLRFAFAGSIKRPRANELDKVIPRSISDKESPMSAQISRATKRLKTAISTLLRDVPRMPRSSV